MKSWEIFKEARDILGKEMFHIFGFRHSRTVNYWAQDPDFSADHKRNPVDRLEELLEGLADKGRRDIALAALRILAKRLDCEIKDRTEVVPDKDTLLEEIVDDMPFLVTYQNALKGDDLEAVDRAESNLLRELAENRVKYIEERGVQNEPTE